ncbi:MAG: hypothetical protein Q8N47_13930 [Bryobacterales bacterium]|nr:hypothetical protein [Bryobacterales bacterium]
MGGWTVTRHPEAPLFHEQALNDFIEREANRGNDCASARDLFAGSNRPLAHHREIDIRLSRGISPNPRAAQQDLHQPVAVKFFQLTPQRNQH